VSTGHDARSSSIQRMVRLLAFPAEWTLLKYTLRHVSGLELWISNGFWFFSVWSPDVHFGLWEKVRLWPSVRRCMKQCQRDHRCDVRWAIRDAALEGKNRTKLERMLDEA
jgi:hypothetical protein